MKLTNALPLVLMSPACPFPVACTYDDRRNVSPRSRLDMPVFDGPSFPPSSQCRKRLALLEARNVPVPDRLVSVPRNAVTTWRSTSHSELNGNLSMYVCSLRRHRPHKFAACTAVETRTREESENWVPIAHQ